MSSDDSKYVIFSIKVFLVSVFLGVSVGALVILLVVGQ